VVLAGLPLFQPRLLNGHDTLAYMPRYVEFYEGLKAGEIFPRWAADLGAGHGEVYFNFNPPLLYYLADLFHALGFTFVASENLVCFVLLALSGLGMYLFAGDVFGRRGGLVAAVAYVFAPYFQVQLYVRHALADFAAFAFVPLAIWSVYRFTRGGGYRFIALGTASVALLMLSSSSVALMTVPALALLVVALAWTNRSWRALGRGAWCVGLGLSLAAFSWVPALAETAYVHIGRRVEPPFGYDFHQYFVSVGQLIYSPWGYGPALPAPDEMSFGVGPVYLLLAIGSLLLFRRIRAASRLAALLVAFFLAVLLLAAFFTTRASAFLWERLSLLAQLQFPFRFLSLVAVGTAFLVGFPFVLVPAERRWLANGLMAVLIAVLIAFGLPHARPQTYLNVTDRDFSPQNIAARGIATSRREFEPIWVQQIPQAPAKESLTVLSGGTARVVEAKLSPGNNQFRVVATAQSRLRLNTFYFPGWTLYVDGAVAPIDQFNPEGLMEFTLSPGQHQVQAVFQDTPVRRWSDWLSLLALLLPVLPVPLGKLHPLGRLRKRIGWR